MIWVYWNNNFSLEDPNDAFWLAQTYFVTHQYSRAEHLLTRPFPSIPRIPSNQANGSHIPSINSLKGKERSTVDDDDLDGLRPAEADSRLVDISVTCRYL